MQITVLRNATLAAAAAFTLGLSGCANIPASYRTQGQVGGGVIGAVVGNALCGGILCTVAGALGGAYAGDRLVQSGAVGEHRAAAAPVYAPTTAYGYESSAAPVRRIHYIHHLHHRHAKRHHRHHTAQ